MEQRRAGAWPAGRRATAGGAAAAPAADGRPASGGGRGGATPSGPAPHRGRPGRARRERLRAAIGEAGGEASGTPSPRWMAGRFVFQNLASGVSRSTSRHSTPVSAFARATAPIISRPSSARYLSTFPCSRAAAKAGRPTGMPSIVAKKPTFLDSAGRMKRTWSSGPSDKLGHSSGAKLAAWRVRGSAWLAKRREMDEDLNKSHWTALFASAFIGYCFISSPTGYKKGCSGCCNCLAGGSRS